MAESAAALAITDTPEFKQAVAAQVEALTKGIVAQVRDDVRSELLAKVKTDNPTDAGGLMEQLALAIAEISDQGTNRKRVAPEILAQRAKAHQEAIEILNGIRENNLQPEYALVSHVYLNERLIPPFMPGPNKTPVRTQIIYTGMPNDAMRPLNDIAKELYAAYRRSIGSVEEKIKGADKRPLWMTQGGVVIKGEPRAQRREVAAPPEFSDLVDIKTQDDPTAPEVQVLGTVAPPARQAQAGTHAAAR